MRKVIRGNYLVYLAIVAVLLLGFFSFREHLTTGSSITANGGHATSDGTSTTISYTYSPSKVQGARARAAIKKIVYLGPSGQIGEVSPTNTDRNIPPSNSGDAKWIIQPPTGVTKPPLDSLRVFSYVYYVDNSTGQKTGEVSPDIETPVLVS